jgi:hypothetical protein
MKAGHSKEQLGIGSFSPRAEHEKKKTRQTEYGGAMNVTLTIADSLAKMISLLLPARLMKSKRYFRLWESKGYHITPVDYSEPLPDTRTLKGSLWTERSELLGIEINERRQLELLSLFLARFRQEYDSFPRGQTSRPYQYYLNNGAFEAVDGEILYCMIRCFKPRKIFEIGSGYSTFLSAQAIQRNKEEDRSYQCELVAIDPYPNPVIRAGLPGLSHLIRTEVQNIPAAKFGELARNDILFIDSSHMLRIGSDVQYEYLEMLPRLNKGVIVHVHDIFLPAEYPREWVLERYQFWNEQYILQAFMTFNESFEVLWSGSYMHLKHPDQLEAAFASYKRDNPPGSFWIRRMK